jgi:8-oxo-dGTP pyrophosphatase MutT (NUDIX family)
MWECTSGSAIAGDDSLAAARREVKEENGLDVLPENGTVVFSYKGSHDFGDVWLFRQDFDLNDVVLQEGETIDAKLATPDDIQRMVNAGEFCVYDYLGALFLEAKTLCL